MPRWLCPALLLAAWTAARPSAGFEVPLPGERSAEVHGFVESRLSLVGDGAPASDMTFSQFRHLLQLEVEAPLFPDGLGPLDGVLLWTRSALSYECLYQRGCGLIKGARSYGAERRDAERLPSTLDEARSSRLFVGGLHGRPITALPDAIRLERQLGSMRLYACRDDLKGSAASHPAPYGALCSLTRERAPAGPYHGMPDASAVSLYSVGRVHAGAFSLPKRFSLLRGARSRIGEERFAELMALLLPDAQGRISGGLSSQQESLRRGLLRAGDAAGAERMRAGSFDQAIPELLAARQDPSLFGVIAAGLEPRLTRTRWGRGRLFDLDVAFTPDLAFPVRPRGYFRGAALDVVSEYSAGLLGALPAGAVLSIPRLSAFAGSHNPYIDPVELQRRGLPFFVGPDGLLGTADDLPSSRTGVTGLDEPIAAASPFARDPRFRYARVGKVVLDGGPVELYGVLEPEPLRRRACEFLARRPAQPTDPPCDPEALGASSARELERIGCELLAGEAGMQRTMGFNADGHCINLNAVHPAYLGGVDTRVLAALGERRFRPADAALEPIHLTDLRLRAEHHSGLPARPSGPGLAFDSPGAASFRRRHRDLASNLGLDFREDDLRWNHGASDDEHEFREGYLELEALRRQLTARLGKLILVWGKTDLFRNVDRVNPLDLSGGSFLPLEELRIGQWGAQLWIQPHAWLSAGPFEDLRLELAWLFDDYEPNDLGRCGEPGAGESACLLQERAIAAGLSGVGVIGQVSPYERDLLERSELGVRLEGRLDRFSFALSDYWGWDDSLVPRSVHSYERKVDRVTGAPLRAGGTRCRWRGAEGRPTDRRAQSVGPNGIRGDDDDVIPSAGDCLLWDAPSSPDERQALRAESAIAASHTVNQTMFHLLCALTFDPDDGFCGLDSWNAPHRFGEVMAVLGGGPLERFAFRDLGLNRIRRRGEASLDADASARERDLLEVELVEAGPPRLRPVNDHANAGVDLYAETGLDEVQRASVGLGGALLRRAGLGAFSAQQAALLGCGPAYASPCNESERADYTGAGFPVDLGMYEVIAGPWSSRLERALARPGSLLLTAKLNPLAGPTRDRPALQAAELGLSQAELGALSEEEKRQIIALGQGTIAASLGRSATQLGGGIDFMNADASVLLQESSVLKAWAPGMFVGTRLGPRGLEWLPGINTQDDGGLHNDFRRSAFALPGESAPFTAERALRMSPDERFRLSAAAWDAQLLDGWIEPMPWRVDPDWARKGVILFQADPVHPFGDPGAYRLPGNHPGRAERLIGSTRNQFNRLPDGTPYGEYCGTLSQARALDHPFARGCTELEILSANLERLTMGVDIVGPDREFDPPESIAELRSWVAARARPRPDEAAVGDPISGPDGIFARNFWADLVLDDPLPGGTGHNDVQDVLAVRASADGRGMGTYVTPFGVEDLRLSEAERVEKRREFFRTYDPSSCPDPDLPCHLKLSLESPSDTRRGEKSVELVAALPIAFPVNEVAPDGRPGRALKVNLLRLELERPLELARLLAGERVFDSQSGKLVVMSAQRRAQLLGDRGRAEGYYQDLDNDEVPDLDRDLDNVWDGQDDFTPGPISDDNILCGPGIPGDVFQEALQYEPYRRSERPGTPKFKAAFADGLPPRSPVFCSSAQLLGATGSTLPIRRAGGDGRYGRIHFAWHDGQQIALEPQKRNVLGLAMDFSEDVTRTTWGLELSYTAGRAFLDSREVRDLISHSDEWMATVSIDRSAYLRFLNPGASFFLNLQAFARLLSDYQGGEDDRDGYYSHTPAPLTALFTFSAQTAYFQGRLSPRSTLIYLPQESQAGVLAQVTYSFTPSLSATIGVAQFFGRAASAQDLYNSIGPGLVSPADVYRTSPQRGLTSVLQRDELWFRLRYAW